MVAARRSWCWPGAWPRSSLKAVAAKRTRLNRLLGGSLRPSSSSSTTIKVSHASLHANCLNVSFCHHIDLTALCRAASDDTPMPLCLMRVCWQLSHTVASCSDIDLALISGDAEGVRAGRHGCACEPCISGPDRDRPKVACETAIEARRELSRHR